MTEKMRFRLISIIALAITLCAVVFPDTAYAEDFGRGWSELTNNTSQITERGKKYYLKTDVTMTHPLSVQREEVVIDLNGHKLTFSGNVDTGAIRVGDGWEASLTIKDSEDGGQIVGANSGRAIIIGNQSTLTLNKGTITGFSASDGGGVYVRPGGTFTMNGGTIRNCKAENPNSVDQVNEGAGVYVDYEATFNMTDGSIENCDAIGIQKTGENITKAWGGGVFSYGSFTMSGGTIQSCSVKEGMGGGVAIHGGVFTLSNNAIISGNSASAGTGRGLYLMGEVARPTMYADGGTITGGVTIRGANVERHDGASGYTKFDCPISLRADQGENRISDDVKVPVTFDGNGGTPASQTLRIFLGQKLEEQPSDPMRDGFVFTGWHYSNGGAYNASDTIDNPSTSIVAWWSRDISNASITIKDESYPFDGSSHRPDVIVEDGGKTLQEDKDYTIAGQRGASDVGKYDLTINGMGDYRGSVTKGWRIVTGTPTINEWPTIGDINVGDTITDDDLGVGSADVDGIFSIMGTPSFDSEGTYSVDVRFTPARDDYATVDGKASVKVIKRQVERITTKIDDIAKPYGTAFSDLGLPSTVHIVASGEKAFTVSVTWNEQEFDPLLMRQSQRISGTLDFSEISNEVEQGDPEIKAEAYVSIRELRIPPVSWPDKKVLYTGKTIAHEFEWPEGISSVTYTYQSLDPLYDSYEPPTNAGTYTVKAKVSVKPGYAYPWNDPTSTLVIERAESPIVSWPTLPDEGSSSVLYVGDEISSSSLNGGHAEIDGSFSVPEGTVFSAAGIYPVEVTFTPSDQQNHKNVTHEVQVHVVKRQVLSVVTQPEISSNLTVGTDISELGLPDKVKITASGNKQFDVSVTWSGYDSDVTTLQTLTGMLDLSAIDNEVEQPAIAVTASAQVTLKERSTGAPDWPEKHAIYSGKPISHEISSKPVGVSDIAYVYTDASGKRYSNPPTNAGTYTVTATFAMKSGYAKLEPLSSTLVIDKAVHSDSATPTGLIATYGQKLSAVSLPAGWTWAKPTQSVGNAGEHSFKANFTPDDSVNFESRKDVDVNVQVNKATDPGSAIPSGLSGIFGRKLSNVSLPEGWAWDTPDASLESVGQQSFKASFTPSDEANYEAVKGADVPVDVKKAPQVIVVPGDLMLTYGDTAEIQAYGAKNLIYTVKSGDDVVDVDKDGTVSTKKAGKATVSVRADADDTHEAATPQDVEITVNKAKQNVTAEDMALACGEQKLIRAAGANTLAYGVTEGPDVVTVDNDGNVTALKTGTAKVTVTASGDDRYEEATAEITINVSKARPIIDANDFSFVYGTSAKIVASGADNLSYEVTSGNDVVTVNGNGDVTAKKAGFATVKITSPGDDNHEPASREIVINVAKAPVIVTASDVNAQTGDSIDWSKADYTVSGTIGDDKLEGVEITLSSNANMGEAGTYAIKVNVSGEDSRYEIIAVDGTLTVMDKPEPAPTPTPTPSPSYYSVRVAEGIEHGAIAVKPDGYVTAGTKITVTTKPDSGYTLETLTVKTSSGREIETTLQDDSTHVFTMPYEAVTVSANFAENNAMLSFFVDVFPGDWYYDSVLWAAENHVTDGVGDSQFFMPLNTCSRAELVGFLYKAAGRPETSNESGFSDVAGDAWYAGPVTWAATNGIVHGWGNGAFGPEDPCTREQFAVMIANYARSVGKYEAVDVSVLDQYPDRGSVSDWATTDVAWGVANGILGNGGYLNGGEQISRAEAVTMLYNFNNDVFPLV